MIERSRTPSQEPFERVSDAVARIAIPLTFFSVPVNVWVIAGERLVLVDCGPRTPEARERLEAGLAKLGRTPDDVAHVIVTHHHVDHGGLLADLVARGAKAWTHEDELENVVDVPGQLERKMEGYGRLALAWGLDQPTRDRVLTVLRGYADFGGVTPRDHVRPLRGGSDVVEVLGARLQAIHVPGHAEGQIVLHVAERNVLFSADHVLERVTPNTAVYVPAYRGRTNGLEDYVASLALLRALPKDVLVCPGHGKPFTGLHARLDQILEHHEERLDEIHLLLTDRPQSIMGLAQQMWAKLEAKDVTLACREVHGHLEILEERGRARREDRDGLWLFRRAA